MNRSCRTIARPRDVQSWILGSLVALFLSTGAGRAQSISLIKAASVASPIQSGQDFDYQITYQVSSTTGDFNNVVITDVLPAGLVYAGTVGQTAHVSSTTTPASGANGTVRFNMVSPLAAGSSGTLTIKVRYPIGTTANGQLATNTATATGTVGSTTVNGTSNPVVTQASADCAWLVDLTGPTSVALNQNLAYRVRLLRPTPNLGNYNITSSSLSIALPAGVLPGHVANSNGGTVSGTGVAGDLTVVTWSIGAISAIGTAGSEAVGRDMIFQFPSPAFAVGNSPELRATASLNLAAGGGACEVSNQQAVPIQAASTAGTTTKAVSVQTASTDGTTLFQWRLTAANTGRTALNNFVLSDNLPPNFALERVYMPDSVTFPPASSFITIRYKRSDTGNTLHTWPGGPYGIQTNMPVSDLGLPSGSYISYIEFDMGNVPTGFTTGSGPTRFRLEGRLVASGWDSPPTVLVTGNPVCNVSTLTGSSFMPPATTTALNASSSSICVTSTVPTVRPTSTKSITSATTIPPGGFIQWQVETANAAGSVSLVNPVGMDLLPSQVEYVPGSFSRRTDSTFNSSGVADPTSSLEVLPNYGGTGRTLLRWTYNGSFAAGTRSTVRFQTRVKSGMLNGLGIVNRSYVWANPSLQSGAVIAYGTPTTDAADLNGDGSPADAIGQSAQQTAFVGPSAAIESLKLVKGTLDTEYSRFPDFGFTTPGGAVNYRLKVSNIGSISVTNIVLLDILPSVNDIGVIDPQPRNSAWTPQLTAAIDVLVNGSAVPGTVVEYSTDANPCRTEFVTAGPVGCTGPGWTTTLPSPLSSIRAFRVTFPATYELAAGDSMTIDIPMIAPAVLTPGSISWNSFAYQVFPIDGSASLKAEPIKVGVASIPPYSVGDRVWLDEDSDGYQDAGEPGIPNVKVDIFDPTGALVASTYTDVQGRYLFTGLLQSDFFVKVDETTLPAGMTQTPPSTLAGADFGNQDQSTGPGDYGYPVKVLTGIPNRTADFGYNFNPAADVNSPTGTPTAALGNRVWVDMNGNGRQEAGEPGVRGVTLQIFTAGSDGLFGTGDDVAGATQVTDSNGQYLFDGLAPGAYVVRVVSAIGASHAILTESYTQTGDPDAFGSAAAAADPATTIPVVLGPGDAFLNADFGYRPGANVTGTVSGTVWLDVDADGSSAPSNINETGMADVTVSVIRDVNGNGAWDAGEPVLATVLTGSTGAYSFTGLPLLDSGDADGTDADYLVWVNDTAGVVSTMVCTYDNQGAADRVGRARLTASTRTDSTGGFSFKPANQPSPPTVLGGMIGDRVWFDTNRNGTFDAAESGIPGVVMEILDGSGNVQAVTVTDISGRYFFSGLNPANSYTVRVGAVNTQDGGPLAGMVNTFDTDGGADASVVVNLAGTNDGVGDPDSTDNGFNLGIDFGFGPPSGASNQGSVSNQVWVDSNADGLRTPSGADGIGGTDDDEPALSGVTLELYRDLNADGTVQPGEPRIATATTDANGQYTFSGLPLTDGLYNREIFGSDPSAAYIVRVTDRSAVLNGYWNTLGSQSQSVDDNSKLDPFAVEVGSAARTVNTVDFGYNVEPAATGNFVWFDLNANGIQDEGELGIDGVKVRLRITYPDGTVTDLYALTGDNPGTVGTERGWFGFGNLLQDEDYRLGTGTGQPTFSLVVETPQNNGPLAGLKATRLLQGASTALDSDDPAGTPAFPVEGVTDYRQFSLGTSEQTPATYDFGFARFYSLGNRVWRDADNDGQQAGDESGIGGVVVKVYAAADATFASPVASVTTDADGYYRFDGLYAGNYVVRIEPSNWTPASGVLEGYNSSTPSQTGVVQGAVVNATDADDNGNNATSPVTTGVISGVITLGGGTGSEEPTGEDNPATYGDGSATGTAAVDNRTNLTVDFGFYRLTVGNFVFEDENYNGVLDPAENGVDGVRVELYDGETRVAVTTTFSGNYSFDQKTDADGVHTGDPLAPGTSYTVRLPATQGVLATEYSAVDATDTGNPGGGVDDDDNVVGMASAFAGLTTPAFTLAAGSGAPAGSTVDVATATTDQPTIDIGLLSASRLVAIGNRVFLDRNANGRMDAGESGIAGVTVQLFANGDLPGVDTPLRTTTTDASGYYYFDALVPATFLVHIPAAEFAPGGHLVGLLSSTGAGGAAKDEGLEEDGVDKSNPEIDGVSATPLALSPGSAPTGELTDAYDGNIPDSGADFTIDFGFRGTAAIGNRVWVDENSDGRQDAGEPGIANATVDLYDASGNLWAATVTDAHGGYRFGNLPAGTYYVDVEDGTGGTSNTLPVTMTQTPPSTLAGADFGNQDHGTAIPSTSLTGYPVAVAVAGENLTADFGYNYNLDTAVNAPAGSPSGVIGDRVWVDTNSNGRQDPSEVGVRGVTLQIFTAGSDGLFGTGDDVAGATATTDSNGRYRFAGLSPGAYVVRVTSSTGADHDVLSTDYTPTGDPDHFGTTGAVNDLSTTTPVVLGPGDVFLNVDFGFQPSESVVGSIGDLVWFDADASGGATAGGANEPGIPGVTVALIRDTNGNGVWDAGEPVIATDATDATGHYRFGGLALSDNGDGDEADADYIVWVNDTDNVLAELVPTYDEDAPANGFSAVSLTAGRPNDLSQDFSYTPAGHSVGYGLLGDTVWLDNGQGGGTAADGIRDDGEPGIEGVLVELYDSDGVVLMGTTRTDENGNYHFGGLDTSLVYKVKIAASNFSAGGVLEGFQNTGDPDGGADSESQVHLDAALNDGNADPDGTKNGINLGQDFGYAATGGGSLGDRVWLDQNADGIHQGPAGPDSVASTDDDETGIAGIRVDLYRDLNGNSRIDPGEPRIATATTDADGLYRFGRLPLVGHGDADPQAEYVVDVVDATGRLQGYWHSLGTNQDANSLLGDDPNDTSKADPFAVEIGSGNDGEPISNNRNVDFGYHVEPAALGNLVWLDANGDGLQDSGESGAKNVVVTLTISYPDSTETVLKTVTDGAGRYEFGNLLLDEDYRMGGGGTQPALVVSVNTVQTPLTGFVPTTLDASSNSRDREDSDDPAGVSALPVKGLTLMSSVSPPTGEPVPASYDFGFKEDAPPTAIVLASLQGYLEDGRVVVEWQTLTEDGTSGFDVERFDLAMHGWIRVNEAFVPALNHELGGLYRVVDRSAPATSVHSYRLVELEDSGRQIVYGPFEVRIQPVASFDGAAVRGGRLQLKFRGQALLHYRIETATDLVRGPWTKVGETGSDGDGRLQYSLPVDDSETVRFFRAVRN